MIHNQKIYRLIASSIIILIIFSSCSAGKEAQRDEKIELTPTNITQIIESESLPTNMPEPTVEIFTPTPDNRSTPDEWQTWPVVPEITNGAIAIYLDGVNTAVNSRAFSKIGDCQNIKEAFLGIYDREGRYYLTEKDAGLQDTIDNFAGFFNRDGLAIEQGLNAAAALSPLHADPDNCEPNESPLQCELRAVNPALAFISFERWWPDVTPPEVYKKYLRSVIEITIENGTIPILITKADNVEGNHQINKIIAELAYEFDIPLYNWWLAAQPLPFRGLDPEREDGFHISVEAWDARSYFALQTLDTYWKGLQEIQ